MTSNIRRSTMSLRINFIRFLRSQSGLKAESDLGLAAFSSLATIQRTAIANSVRREMVRVNGIHAPSGGEFGRDGMVRSRSLLEHVEKHTSSNTNPSFARSFASKASKKDGETPSEARKDVSTVEDPFDAPTYNIPEKPVTFTEGASYSVIILAGLGVAAAAGYAVFKELIFEPKEYKIFNKALKRVQDDSQVRVRIGSPITGYGQESRNRAARQRISNKVFTDEDGVEHVQISFYIRGPHGAGKVFAEMFKDKVDKEWKYTYLIVQFMQPSQTQLILESYMPAPAQVAA
ncbi:hypothetical protein K2173_011288 [Erythroxylum novogranatense]|uniref:Mitochondrial import inner membrane translocase subunit Tim21 n=1 Tax=Erythroxylum novogranatense TaxID=1862640 RepID=A0AAV8S956_9ROSI|nr:hypothetical protein K2173_011288 [Erythroxylum novogranatense]